jgi:predicted anti-sigma-YlaC factor YlaD
MDDTLTDAELDEWSRAMNNLLVDAEVAEQLSGCPGCPNWNAAIAELERARAQIARLEAQLASFGTMLDAIIAEIDADLAAEAEIMDGRGG